MQCQHCGEVIPEHDFDRDMLIGTCQKCHSITDFYDDHETLKKMNITNGERKIPAMLPEGIRMEQSDSGIIIKCSWYRGSQSILLLFFAIICDIFIPVMLFKTTGGGFMGFIFFISILISLNYITLTHFFNKTVFYVNNRSISISHEPFPWPGNKDIISSVITQLYCKRYSNNRSEHNIFYYSLIAKISHGTETILLDGLENPYQALFIEKEIEKFLDIKNVPVKGEIKYT